MAAKNLKKLGFDLAYLSLLTKAGLKPLSRWEKEFGPETEELLHDLGLKTRTVWRTVRSGKRIRELLFSNSRHCLELYASRFDGTPVDRSPMNRRIEGLLFGYPSCCVENYIAKGYAKNSLRRSEQSILFHWACPNCAITPLLLPYYSKVYVEARKAMRGRVSSALCTVREAVLADHMRRAIATAASLVALGAAPGSDAKYQGGDPHRLPLEEWEDEDRDYLSGDEEALLHMDPADPDEDHNTVADGVDLAMALSAAIDSLPTEPSSQNTYVTHVPMYGLEGCEVCGESVNMGFMEIVNPMENLSITVSYIAKHYMEHGSFSYAGGIHKGRINVALLNTVLGSDGLAHFTPEPEGTDGDNDGLRDWEEPVFATDPKEPDTDGDGILDGIDLARELRAQLDLLPRKESTEEPYIRENPMDGIEICPRCGEAVVMDIWEVMNPVTGGYIAIPSMALHFMEHGGFNWEGAYLLAGDGRVDPRHLRAVLTGEGDGHLLHVSPDADSDLLTDEEEFDLHSDSRNPDENQNGILDGFELAKTAASEISGLPTKPSPSEVYRVDVQLKGLEWCAICGKEVNMGHLTVCNPLARLYAKVPYIGLHYMEHGSFSFAADYHGEGRLDVKLLLDALHSSGPPHILDVPDDSDGDGLKDREEDYFGTDKTVEDSDLDGVPDGFALARKMWQAVEALPRLPGEGTYAVDHMMRGLVACRVCGLSLNMGYLEVVNPKENIHLEIPYLALHCMRHGSFSYQGILPRVNPCLLDLALRGDGTSHFMVVGKDGDADGLLDVEEAHFGTRPDNPDTDGDGLKDGVEVARRMHRQIKGLPTVENPVTTYLTHCETYGTVLCPICGEEINMGHVVVTNPSTALSMDISYLQLHFMELGSFATPSETRVDPVLLGAILRPGVVIANGEEETTLKWKGVVGKTYQVFTSASPAGPWEPGPTFDGNGEELVYSDNSYPGTDRRFYKILAW